MANTHPCTSKLPGQAELHPRGFVHGEWRTQNLHRRTRHTRRPLHITVRQRDHRLIQQRRHMRQNVRCVHPYARGAIT
ncbi:MAG: hypothetical protein D6802_04020 [Ardenticatenia bacterium]|nr:MAG: hypothetical protein D6802_04020 [Ardenticatenia bacterium]